MADTKISALTDGAPAQGTDIVPVARGGANRRLTVANINDLAGDIKSDGTVDFIGTETWDFGGTDTVAISDTGVTVADATDSTTIVKDQITATDGTAIGAFSRLGLAVTDGAGSAANVTSSELNTYNGTGDSTHIYPNRIDMIHGATNAASEVFFIKYTIVGDDVKSLNSIPKEIIGQPGGGKAINVLSCVAVNTVGAVPFTSNNIHLDCGGGTTQYLLTTSDNFLNTATTLIERMFPNSNTAVSAVLIEDTPLTIMADADSAVGDGTIALYITYQIIVL